MSELNIKKLNYLTAADIVQVTANAVGVELNDPYEFVEGTNRISIARLTLKPDSGFERHVHPFNHVLTILEGSGFLVYDRGDGKDIRLDFDSGDVFNVPGTNEHAVSAGPDGITMLSIGSPPMQLIDPARMVFTETHSSDLPRFLTD